MSSYLHIIFSYKPVSVLNDQSRETRWEILDLVSLGEPDTYETGVVKCEKVNVGCRLPTGEIQYETRERERNRHLDNQT